MLGPLGGQISGDPAVCVRRRMLESLSLAHDSAGCVQLALGDELGGNRGTHSSSTPHSSQEKEPGTSPRRARRSVWQTCLETSVRLQSREWQGEGTWGGEASTKIQGLLS